MGLALAFFLRYIAISHVMENASRFNKVGAILRLKCPNCGKTNVFYKGKYLLVGTPQMKEVCESCGYSFDREPGYFRGATYLSYTLALIEGLIAFLLAKYLIYGITNVELVLVTVAAILLCAVWNYRLARVMWMNIAPDKNQ
ncbi:hypothetical protein CNR22_17170 [Sphingobacteriaceae bacterium]|nr:hypothetical protein CNR22_17170 [Sphingobacteriaceae bacterium]